MISFNKQIELIVSDVREIEEILPFGDLFLKNNGTLADIALKLQSNEIPHRWFSPLTQMRKSISIIHFIHRASLPPPSLLFSDLSRRCRMSPSFQRVLFASERVAERRPDRFAFDSARETVLPVDPTGQGLAEQFQSRSSTSLLSSLPSLHLSS